MPAESADIAGIDRDRELPLLGHPPRERADAARNRRKILTAAERIVARQGISGLSMYAVATAAGVGVGTVYRRFGDIGGLAEALVDEHERHLQQQFIAGDPPLGPGAPPVQRIRAFLHAYIDLLAFFAELMVVVETTASATYYTSGAYRVHHLHLANLVRQARPGADAHYLADGLLASVSASLFVHQHRREGLSIERIKAGIDDLLAGAQADPPAASAAERHP